MTAQQIPDEQKQEIINCFHDYLNFIKEQSDDFARKRNKLRDEHPNANLEVLAEHEIILVESTLDDFEKSDEFNLLMASLLRVWFMRHPRENWKEKAELIGEDEYLIDLGKLFPEEIDWLAYGIKNYFRSTGIYDCVLNSKPLDPNPDEFIESIFELVCIKEKYVSCIIVSTPIKVSNEPEYLPLTKRSSDWWAKVTLEFAKRNYPRYYRSLMNAPWIDLPSSKIISNYFVLIKNHQDTGEDFVWADSFNQEKLVLQLASENDLSFSDTMLFNLNPCSTCNTSAYFQIPEERFHPFFRSYRDSTKYDLYKVDYERKAEATKFDSRFLDLISNIIPVGDEHKRSNWVGKIFNKSCESADNDMKFMFLWAIIESLGKFNPNERRPNCIQINLGAICGAANSKFTNLVNHIDDVRNAKSEFAHGDYEYDFDKFALAMKKYIPDFDIHYLRSFARFLILYCFSAYYSLRNGGHVRQPEETIRKFFEVLKSRSELGNLNSKIIEYWGEYGEMISP